AEAPRIRETSAGPRFARGRSPANTETNAPGVHGRSFLSFADDLRQAGRRPAPADVVTRSARIRVTRGVLLTLCAFAPLRETRFRRFATSPRQAGPRTSKLGPRSSAVAPRASAPVCLTIAWSRRRAKR